MPSILYVEDEVLLAIAIADALERNGMTVRLAHDGREGMRQALLDKPDLIVSDYMMPRMDGLEMLLGLRALGVTAPAILTTAVPRSDLDPGVWTQVQGYIAKPFEERLLARQIATLLAQPRH